MARKRYRNGDPIELSCGCDGCSPAMINGLLCHETGCPDAWRDHDKKCFDCGCDFIPSFRDSAKCYDCLFDAIVSSCDDDDEDQDEEDEDE